MKFRIACLGGLLLGASLVSTATAQGVVVPQPPPGWHPVRTTQGLHEIATMSDGDVVMSSGLQRQPLPAGTINASAGWYYWTWNDEICAPWPLGCNLWSMSQFMDGVTNATSIWQWDHGGTPGGTASITWAGYLFNGGTTHYSYVYHMYLKAMQFGVNGMACEPFKAFCYGHGFRQWIDVGDGAPDDYYDW